MARAAASAEVVLPCSLQKEEQFTCATRCHVEGFARLLGNEVPVILCNRLQWQGGATVEHFVRIVTFLFEKVPKLGS